MKLYAYCLSDEATPEMLGAVAGVETSAPRIVECGPLSVVVSEFAGGRIAQTRENVEAHNRVNAQLLGHTTPLPFRFGTLADPAQLEGYVREHATELSAALGRVRGTVEMSLKIMWDIEGERRDADAALHNADAAAHGSNAAAHGADVATVRAGGGAHGAVAAAGGAEPHGAGSGTAFLAARRRALAGDAALAERAAEIGAWLTENLRGVIREERVTVSAAQALVVRAAHLVERARLEEYRERVRRLREERRARLRFLASGPWPPYSFTER